MNLVSLTCPVCRTPYGADEAFCPNCGLIFGSQPAPNAGTMRQGAHAPSPAVVCPACGRVARSGARNCGGCGTALSVRYAPLVTGRRLANGRYTVQHALSKGGMGAIYLAADHETFDRQVVIKAMLDYFDPTDREAVQAAKSVFSRRRVPCRHCAIPRSHRSTAILPMGRTTTS